MIRVVVVEDSPTARALLVGILSHHPELEVVGQAGDGLAGIELVHRLRPDVVTMDVQMPRLDGFEATKRIMTELPTPIVVISSLDVESTRFAMEALEAGALAVLSKPAGPSSPDFERSARQLTAMVRAMSQVKLVRRWPAKLAAPQSRQPVSPRSAPGAPIRCVAVAASTGGPGALRRLFASWPANFAASVLVVQHISHGFARGFAEWLDDVSPLRVKQAEAGEALIAGTVYVAPDDQHLGVSSRSTIALSSGPPVGSFRPSATTLFESAADAFGGSAAAVVLTGMGNDGARGLASVRARGGLILAQDRASSDIYGMPQAAVATGLVDHELPLEEIAALLADRVGPSSKPR